MDLPDSALRPSYWWDLSGSALLPVRSVRVVRFDTAARVIGEDHSGFSQAEACPVQFQLPALFVGVVRFSPAASVICESLSSSALLHVRLVGLAQSAQLTALFWGPARFSLAAGAFGGTCPVIARSAQLPTFFLRLVQFSPDAAVICEMAGRPHFRRCSWDMPGSAQFPVHVTCLVQRSWQFLPSCRRP